ncbi:lasso RiPP family leader peptide-containing protein, partial [Parafrankia sp. Ea1.12]
MKATYEAPAIQARGSFRDVTRHGFIIIGRGGGWGWG